MAVKKLLFTDRDLRDGMDKLFDEGVHYLGYEDQRELEKKVNWSIWNENASYTIAQNGYEEVLQKHCVTHRIDSILEVINETHT